MGRAMFARSLVAASLLLGSCATPASETETASTGQAAFLEACEEWDDWSKPAPPFRIYGNSYYVGTCGLSAILIAGEDGHILIDGASRDGGPLVAANIEKLGFRVEDISLLLHSHEHFDHVGGLAYLQQRSGAEVIASSGARAALETGETQLDDPQFGMHEPFEPVAVARTVRSGEPVSTGKLALIPLETPGHTPGALSWLWWSCEKTDCKTLVYADSLSPLGSEDYRFSAHPEYVEKYRKGLAELSELPCDILLTPHPSASWMFRRMRDAGGLIGSGSCADYAASVGQRLDKKLASEAGRP